MLTVEEALTQIAAAVGTVPVATERVPLAAARGRVLARDVHMDHDVPPFRRAAMDGFAVATGSLEVGQAFRVGPAVMAGDVPDTPIQGDLAARVMTGAPVPEGAAAVVPFEWTREEGGRFVVERLPRPLDGERGGNIVERGTHVGAGDLVRGRGTPITPAVLGALASAGVAEPEVAVRPRVALLGTGSELVGVGETPGPGAIRNSNNATLVGQIARAGGEAVDLGTVRDEQALLRAAIRRGLEHDVLILSGGVSRGDLDLVPGALEACGVTCLFHRWSVQPGGPLWLGARDGRLVFGLPGNPAGVFVGCEVLVVPALALLLGLGMAPRRTLRARYEGPWGKPGPRRRFRPVRLETDADATLVARAAPWKGSGDPFGLAGGDALAIFPEGAAAGEDGVTLLDVIPVHGADLLWGRQ